MLKDRTLEVSLNVTDLFFIYDNHFCSRQFKSYVLLKVSLNALCYFSAHQHRSVIFLQIKGRKITVEIFSLYFQSIPRIS